MASVLEVTPEERPLLSYLIARTLPLWRQGSAEQQEVAARLTYVLRAMDEAPAGPGEVELFTEDLYELGIHLFASSVDLEQYWLDRRELAQGREAAEIAEPEVVMAARRYLPEVETDPNAWEYRTIQPAIIDLGFKIDRLLTAEAPRVRGLYNKERTVTTRRASERKNQNAAFRDQRQKAAAFASPTQLVPIAIGSADGQHDAEAPVARPRPMGTARQAAGRGGAGLSVVSRATYPPQYPWGVETGTGVSFEDLEPGRAKRANVGGSELMLAEIDGKVCAAARICPHRGWDLSKSPVEGGTIACSLHG
ncbi:MAG: Rieske (2Fe-2S) protein, partial [Dehalococcoidia bacterium]